MAAECDGSGLVRTAQVETVRSGQPGQSSAFTLNADFTAGWWHRMLMSGTFGSAWRGDDEIARFALRFDVDLPSYSWTSAGRPLADIDLFEVAESHRGVGIGTLVIQAVTNSRPDYRFAALSQEADEFWASLGWARIPPPDAHSRPIFLQA